jgi:hypothetical protein
LASAPHLLDHEALDLAGRDGLGRAGVPAALLALAAVEARAWRTLTRSDSYSSAERESEVRGGPEGAFFFWLAAKRRGSISVH